MDRSITLEELLELPIEVPKNPYWEVFKRFGRDETFALIMNVIGTAGVDALFDSKFLESMVGPISNKTKKITQATAGPIIEKTGFFPGNFWDAYKEFKSTPKDQRDSFSTYFRSALKNTSKSLIEDILLHDTLYVGLMYAGLTFCPFIPPPAMAALSFGIALGAVSVAEVAAVEGWFHKYKKSMAKMGFVEESYYESRFLIRKSVSEKEVMQFFRDPQTYNLDKKIINHYQDRYFENNLPSFNGRLGRVRFRERKNEKDEVTKSVQLVYRKLGEMYKKYPGQFRFYPQLKQKIYKLLDHEMPCCPEQIEDENLKRYLKRVVQREKGCCDVGFTRTALFDSRSILNPEVEVYHQEPNENDNILVTIDHVHHNSKPYFVLELKVHKDTDLLIQAMRDVMIHFPFLQTTYGKRRLSEMCDCE